MITELKKGVYWVGVVDWGLRHFHGHELSTHRGSTYNSYLILDEKIVLVDTVWGPFQDQFIENIKTGHRPRAKSTIVVANHAETDHSGGLPAVMRCAPECDRRRLQAGRGEHRRALSPALEFPGGQDRREDQHRDERPGLRRGPDAALAGQHVHLPHGPQHPHAQRRLRAALRHRLPLQRPGGPARNCTRRR